MSREQFAHLLQDALAQHSELVGGPTAETECFAESLVDLAFPDPEDRDWIKRRLWPEAA